MLAPSAPQKETKIITAFFRAVFSSLFAEQLLLLFSHLVYLAVFYGLERKKKPKRNDTAHHAAPRIESPTQRPMPSADQ